MNKPVVAVADKVHEITTDNFAIGFDEAIDRLRKAANIGVDILFFEAMQDRDECQRVTKELSPSPVLLNMVPGGVTPVLSVSEARDMGFRIMIFPGLAMGPVIKAVNEELDFLRKNGTTKPGNKAGEIREAFKLCGLQDCINIDTKAGGNAYADVSGNDK